RACGSPHECAEKPSTLITTTPWWGIVSPRNDKSRSTSISLSHRRRVAVRLLGIGGTEACDRVGVDGPLGRADINARPRLVVEMPVAVGAPHQHSGQSCAAGAAHVGRDVAEAETDAPVG